MSGFVRRGTVACAIAVAIVAAAPAPGAQADPGGSGIAAPAVSETPGITAQAVGGPGAGDAQTLDDPPLGDNPDAGIETDFDQRLAAAAGLRRDSRRAENVSGQRVLLLLFEAA